MYVDESGDPGVGTSSPTNHFVLSGVVIHESAWHDTLNSMVQFRRFLKKAYGITIREELHSGHMLTRRSTKSMKALTKHQKLIIIKRFATLVSQLSHLRIINIVVNKTNKSSTDDVFSLAWSALIQRFENTMVAGNFPDVLDSTKEQGLLIPDNTDVKKLTQLLRKMRHFNAVPNMRLMYNSGNRNMQIKKVIEDPYFKNSQDSYFIQIADLAAFLLYQKISPSAYMRKKGAINLFDILDPILFKKATYANRQGIVHL